MYNIHMLPVSGYDDLTLDVQKFQTRWQETLRIIDGVRATPEMSSTLSMSLDSLRFHVGTVLAAIDQFLRSGGAVMDDAFEVPSVDVSIKTYQQELLRTKAHWDAWAAGETANFSAVQQEVQSEQQALMEATRPQTNVESLIFLGGGALVIGLLLLMRK